MNNQWVKYGIYFVFIILIQGLVMNQLQASELIYPMVYVMVLLVLPFETSLLISILISLILGVCVDTLSDTFGLHTSASLTIGYLRPYLLSVIKPRDGYDNKLIPTIHDMGKTWFLMYAFILLSIHHLWFFGFEILRFDLTDLILFKTILSVISSLVLIVLLQYLLYKPTKQ